MREGWGMRKKTIIVVLLSVIMGTVLSGCAGRNTDTEQQSAGTGTLTDTGFRIGEQTAEAEADAELKETVPDYAAGIKGIEKLLEPIDYSDADNWLALPEDGEKKVDVIYLYPTVYGTLTEAENEVADVEDITMRLGAAFSEATQASVFEESCNVYAPVYRQLTVDCLLGLIDHNEEAMRYVASKDLYQMLDYYFEYENQGKPFILAGHSQGSVWLTVILEDYMKQHPEYLQNMVAAYVIGYSVTEEYLERNPHLQFATGAEDVGVIISYNTEGPGNKDRYNCVVRDGAIAINPVNWMRDATYAPAQENPGSLSLTGEIVSGYADARVDLERGVVVCESVVQSQQLQEAMQPYFGPESYHLSDYSLYYVSLQRNVADRIRAFFTLREDSLS